jgi:hypothetical protein
MATVELKLQTCGGRWSGDRGGAAGGGSHEVGRGRARQVEIATQSLQAALRRTATLPSAATIVVFLTYFARGG